MFNIGPEKLVLLMVIALVVLGPQKLPEAARTLGKMVAELRRMAGTARTEMREALSDPGDAISGAVIELRESLRAPMTLSGDVPPAVTPPAAIPPFTASPRPVQPDDPSLN
jgi:sec-independent protein translocase protein TatB